MNRRNLRRAINFLKNSPPPKFAMESWFCVPKATIANSKHNCLSGIVDSLSEAEIFGPINECGTSACLAGTIQFNAAKTKDEKRMNAVTFAEIFLDCEFAYEILFTDPMTYGFTSLSRVTQESVENTLIALFNTVNPDEALEDYIIDDSGSLLDYLKTLPMVKPSRRY